MPQEPEDRPVVKTPVGALTDFTDPPVGSTQPWNERERQLLDLGIDALRILENDGETLPARISARLSNHSYLEYVSDLSWLNG